mmetsp:Transcript_28698/g.56382  ORF Transcript_28698/g.56382 Transcript_28698/m.56382 type:complete len:302 (+) Transcript_28698:407-1312(+)|eukprot:CAMPEP_0175133584 /NCGR_PEP_ID=MMETSP0087-20121206/7727_1 /TAXON_ID=136419 /ORGANISM="Unknown Unknown, Strain D1" /LENGTH=301 /DNA_ID=CAMNT_0016416097 /DNA_START=332 /DNA_END=1237 /DNA_ORIENTATION=-
MEGKAVPQFFFPLFKGFCVALLLVSILCDVLAIYFDTYLFKGIFYAIFSALWVTLAATTFYSGKKVYQSALQLNNEVSKMMNNPRPKTYLKKFHSTIYMFVGISTVGALVTAYYSYLSLSEWSEGTSYTGWVWIQTGFVYQIPCLLLLGYTTFAMFQPLSRRLDALLALRGDHLGDRVRQSIQFAERITKGKTTTKFPFFTNSHSIGSDEPFSQAARGNSGFKRSYLLSGLKAHKEVISTRKTSGVGTFLTPDATPVPTPDATTPVNGSPSQPTRLLPVESIGTDRQHTQSVAAQVNDKAN